MASLTETRPPLPPFTRDTAIQKVRLAEDGWNTRDAEKVSLAYSLHTKWRNRVEFVTHREEAKAFLKRKWENVNGRNVMDASPSLTSGSEAQAVDPPGRRHQVPKAW